MFFTHVLCKLEDEDIKSTKLLSRLLLHVFTFHLKLLKNVNFCNGIYVHKDTNFAVRESPCRSFKELGFFFNSLMIEVFIIYEPVQ